MINSETPFAEETLGGERIESLPSTNGLGTPNVDAEDEEVSCPPKGCPNTNSSLDAAVLGIEMKDSACHSYQTWCSLVSRQMDT